MAQRLILAVFVVFLVLVASVAQADDKSTTHQGIVVSVQGNRLTMTDKDGRNMHTHVIPDGAPITYEGSVCRLQDVRRGMFVTVTMEQQGNKSEVVLIEATRAPLR